MASQLVQAATMYECEQREPLPLLSLPSIIFLFIGGKNSEDSETKDTWNFSEKKTTTTAAHTAPSFDFITASTAWQGLESYRDFYGEQINSNSFSRHFR